MTYIVKSGDTLWRIAVLYSVTIQNLIDWNKLVSTTIRIGQPLIVTNPALSIQPIIVLKPSLSSQIGTVEILQNTPLVDNSLKTIRLLTKGQAYKAYELQQGYYNLGGSQWVKNDANVKFTSIIVQPTPIVTPSPSVPAISYKTYTKYIGSRPIKIFVAKVQIDKVNAEVVYPARVSTRETVPTMAKRCSFGVADLAINASFYSGYQVIGRHLNQGVQVPSQGASRPALILDTWDLVTTQETWWQLRDKGYRNFFASYPELIINGKIGVGIHGDSLKGTHPRSAIGRNGNELIVMVVDGRRVGWSLGCTLTELAQFMWNEGARDFALNLDGGGSSIFWMDGATKNKPSDGHPREIMNSLCFKKK